MNRLDDLIDELAGGRISRRQFMQRAAALGLSASALSMLGSAHVLAASGGKVVWVSPRGTLDVLDDYAYWTGKHMGYFGDLDTVMQGGPGTATATVTLVASGKADVGFPSPGVFSGALQEGVDVVSVFNEVATETFDFAFPKGKMPADLKELEGKTMVLGDAGWELITNPLLAQFGVDYKKINYVVAGVTAWGQVLAQGRGDVALSWEGLRAQWGAAGLHFDYWLGKDHSKFPANTFVIRRKDFEDPSKKDLYTKYLRGWAMGLEFGYHNPRAATQITMNSPEISTALKQAFPDVGVAVQSMWEQNLIFRGDWAKRKGWGWHDIAGWDLYFKTVKQIGQVTKDITASEVVSNDLIAGVNDFDHTKVENDAKKFKLSPEFEKAPVPGPDA